MNLISALDSRPPQPSPSASSLLSQFRTSSWQTAMHTPAPTDLFISGALPGSSSFHSSSALSAYQNPSIFSGRSFTPSLSLQDTTTFSQTSNGLISPHDPLVHIKRSSQSSLGFDHLLSSQSTAFKGSQESATPQTQDPSTSSNCHLSPPQFNLLPSQLHNSSSQPYNASMLSSMAALPPAILPEPQPLQQTAISRHNSVIKHYPLSSSAYTTTLQSQSYASSDGSSGYHQLVSHYQHAGVSYSPLGERSLSSDPKTSPRMESQIYQPVIQTAYTSSLSTSSTPSSSTATTKGAKSSCSTSNYSSSSCTPQTPPSTSSTSSSSSSSSKTSTISLSAPSLQQPAPQSALVPPLLPVVSSSLVQQAAANQCLSTYGSQSVTKPSTSLPNHTPPQQHIQSYSLNLPPSTHMTVHYDGFNSPHVRDLSTGARSSGGKDFMGVGSGERSFSAEIIIQDSSFVSTSLRKPQSPSIDYGSGSAGSGPGIHSVLGSAGTGNGAAGNEGSNAYHLTESSTSPSTNSTISYSGLHSPVAARPVQSPGGSGANKYLSSIPAPTFMSSPQGFPDKRQARKQLYHSSPPNTKTEATNMLGAEESQDEGDSEDFLIHHLLHPQSSNPHFSQHHPHSEQLSQPILHGESKGMTYDLNKISEERYQLQSVIRTNNITSNSGLGMAINDTVSLDRPLEISQKKQQARSDSIISKSNASGVRRISDSHSHAIHSHHQQNELMGSAVYYGRGDPYIQHPNSQHHHSTSHVSTHSQHYTQHSRISQHFLLTQHTHHSQHSQHIHRNSLPQSHSLIEIKKPSDANDNAYYPPDVQQTRQSHVSVSLMNTSPDHPKQTHMLQSVPSHTIQNKLDSQQAPQQQQKHQQQQQQQHQQAMMGSVRRVGSAGLESHVQNRSSQMQLQLQTQRLDTHYSGSHPTYQTGASQSSVSPLQMLDQSLSQANGTDSGRSLDRSGADMNSHFLSEQDLDLYTPSHLSHLNQPQTHPHTHALQHTQHTHHQLSVTTQITNSHLQQMTIHLATPQQQQSQATDPETQLSHSQLEQLKQHQFETVSQTDKVGQTQAQLQQCAPLTSICFPDCVFLEMEDMFCSSEYKSGYTGARHSAQENLSRGHGPIQEDMEALKSGGAAEGYNMVGHHSNQGFGQYCQGLCQGNGDLHLDHDCLKTHELPSTVNTDQLGLIQSQTPIMGLNSAVQGDSLVNKMIATVGVGGNSNSTGVTSPIFCSSRPKKLLRTSSFHLLKQRREPQPQTKKNYAQEYEFGDDEDKADVPADIRLNNRRLPDLLPDLVSSCRKPGGVSGISGLSPQTGDMDFCHPSSYSSLGHASQHPPNDGPKKRGRKPTKPKREGPPRPRGRPRIRPLPEPPYCRGLMGSVAGENRRGRGRGRARCRREEGKVRMHRDMNKTQSLSYNHQQQYQQQQYSQQQHLQHHQQQDHRQQADLHQVPHQQPQQHHHHHQQEHISCPHPQLHHQQQQHTSHQSQQDPVRTFKIKLHLATMSPPESLLRTDSLSSSNPVPSEGSVGSAPSLGLSPGPSTTVDYNRNEVNQTKDEIMIHQQRAQEIDEKVFDFKPSFMASFLDFLKTGKKQPDLEPRHDGGNQETCSSMRGGIKCLSSPSPPLPPTSPQQPPGPFSDGSQGEGPDLALSSCQSSCKPLDDELKRNLGTLPSFSSDEEDSVSKNQDLQKSISSAISALYDTPHSLAAAVASAVVKVQPMLSPPTPQEPSLSPPLKTMSPLIPSMESIKDGALAHTQHNTQNKQNTREEQKMISILSDMEWVGSEHGKEEENSKKEEEGEEIANKEENMRHSYNMLQGAAGKQEKQDTASDTQIMEGPKFKGHDDLPSGRVPAPAPPSPFISSSPLTYSSPSPLPPPSISVPSPPPIQQNEEEVSLNDLSSDQHMQQSSYQQAPTAASSPPPSTSPPVIPSSPLSNLPFGQSIPPPSTTPPPSSSDQDQEPEAGLPYFFSTLSSSPSSLSSHPPSPPTPEEAPQSQRLTSLHLAKKQADAAIAGESEEEDSESGGEGIFRERDEFVVRTEDIGTLKMALQTGREPPPIWRVQKALLQKFSPEIKDGQRQFCATSNYLGYFGDAKVYYQRLYVKFLENVNKKDYVRVCSRKPWHRAGLILRRQPLPKQLLTIHNQSQPRIDSRHKERRNERELMEQRERERRERETRKKVETEHKERERKEGRDRKEQQKEERQKKEKDGREQNERGHRDVKMEWKKESESERREKEKKERELKERQQRKKEQSEKVKQDREQRERMKQEREWKEKERSLREQRDRDRQEREWGERHRGQKDREQREMETDSEQKEKEKAQEKEKKKNMEQVNRDYTMALKEEKNRGDIKIAFQGRANTSKDKAEPPPKKRKKWLKAVLSSSSESDYFLLSDDEGPARGGVNSRAMRDMFRSYVEMLVSTALDPDMIQALEDTDDELYLPPMRKIDSMLSEQKKKLLRRVNMSAQHQEVLHIFPRMTADPVESGDVKVHLGGEGYNRKTLNQVKRSIPKQQDMKLSIEICQIYSLYHSLHHYKYHTFLHCKKETDNIEQAAEDPGQEEVVQQCMANQGWLESLFSSFMELLTLSAKT
ncbi:unnamed protein product [Oreochromis niloticus]|nr:unnamed protein product [Mustela putorius furo]